MEIATILLSFIGFGVTLSTFILGYIVKELRDIKREEIRPMKGRIDTLWSSFFGIEAEGETVVEGHMEEAGAERESMRMMLEKTREDHHHLRDLFHDSHTYLEDLGQRLAEHDNIEDVPQVNDDDYVGNFDENRWRSDD